MTFLNLIRVVILISWWRRECFVFYYREFSEAWFWHQHMGLFMRLVPCTHTEAVQKPITLSYLNCLPTLSCLGIRLFRLYRIKILEPKQAPVEDPWRWCVHVCCTECVNTLSSIHSFWAIKQDPYFLSDCSIWVMDCRTLPIACQFV